MRITSRKSSYEAVLPVAAGDARARRRRWPGEVLPGNGRPLSAVDIIENDKVCRILLPCRMFLQWAEQGVESMLSSPRPARRREWESRGTRPSGAVRVGPPAAQANAMVNFSVNEYNADAAGDAGRKAA